MKMVDCTKGQVPFGKLFMTSGARKKANLAVEALQELAGAPLEYYAYLLTSQSEPNIVRDIYFPKNQSNSGAHTAVPAEEVVAAAKDIRELGYRVAGWCHAHPGFSTNPSQTDWQNNQDMLDQLAASNLYEWNRSLIQCGDSLDLRVDDKTNGNAKVRVLTGDAYVPFIQFEIETGGLYSFLARHILPRIRVKNLGMQVPRIAGFSFSIVVNGREGQEHSGITYVTNCGFCDTRPEYKFAKIPLETLAVPDDITVTADALMQELRGKVRGHYAGQV